ncbi:uncharacterized protein LOC143253095 isoform X1 [Tachypleus tridentatus]|uniref:uncharacterized protein LOC143253095 isoform X1 n=1 Tax=Tachypleus tridentatus TaxID=6853 RepID=UPI003FCF1592
MYFYSILYCKVSLVYVTLYPLMDHSNGTKSAVLGVHFTVQENHFHNGEMRLNCTATFVKTVNTVHVETVIGANQQSSGLQSPTKEGRRSGGANSLGCCVWKPLFTILLSLWFVCG